MADTPEEPTEPLEAQWYNDPYLRDTKAPVELLGAAMLVNPFADHSSSQRLMMFSNHLAQAQMIRGCEHPRIFTGYETIFGQYEFNPTERDQDIQIREVISKYQVNTGADHISDNPSFYVIYRGDTDGKVGYFTLDQHLLRSEGFGYPNKWNDAALAQLNRGNFIPKELKLSTSPAHDGSKYMQGTNLNVAYMSLPQNTEDAFIISRRAAEKLTSDIYGTISFKILPDQIPIDLYGDEDEYKFMPDIGERVNPDGILCAMRSPTSTSIIYDMAPANLRRVQYLHDTIIYAPPGAEIIDLDITVNRNCKIKTPKDVFSQVEKYRSAVNQCYLQIWSAYLQACNEGLSVTPAFNNLVTRALGNLLIDNVRIPTFSRKTTKVSAVRRKEPIEFIYITVTYRQKNPCRLGEKLAGRYGNEVTKF